MAAENGSRVDRMIAAWREMSDAERAEFMSLDEVREMVERDEQIHVEDDDD